MLVYTSCNFHPILLHHLLQTIFVVFSSSVWPESIFLFCKNSLLLKFNLEALIVIKIPLITLPAVFDKVIGWRFFLWNYNFSSLWKQSYLSTGATRWDQWQGVLPRKPQDNPPARRLATNWKAEKKDVRENIVILPLHGKIFKIVALLAIKLQFSVGKC